MYQNSNTTIHDEVFQCFFKPPHARMEKACVSSRMYSRISSPTCEDLGIPINDIGLSGQPGEVCYNSSPNESLIVDGLTYTTSNPFSPYCRIPLPNPFGTYEYELEPAFIRKRNERERERVRCVNDGYAKLRQHLPLSNKEKRISKVETLRGAIRYIKHLETLLGKRFDCSDEPVCLVTHTKGRSKNFNTKTHKSKTKYQQATCSGESKSRD